MPILRGWTYLVVAFASVLAAQTANWTQQATPTASPSGRGTGILAYDSKHGQIVLFSGASSGGVQNDTWIWNGSGWSITQPLQSPPARSNSAMVYDSAHDQIVVFGGQAGTTSMVLGDTWLFDGSDWTQSVQAGPPARTQQGMAYDSQHGQTVMFGGLDGNGIPLNDTWLWNGTGWTQARPQSSPPARWGDSMAYDSTRGQVVLFGGYSGSSVLGDTWLWNGTNWTLATPQNSPPARCLHEMVYDTAHNQTILFGGGTSNSAQTGLFNDTWYWNGSNWDQATLANNPSPRNRLGLAFDAGRAQAVLFGGRDASMDYLGDTWTWSVTAPPPPSPMITSVESASGFGGLSGVAPGSWVEIYGSDLAPVTRQWAGSDFTGNDAPTSLNGVQVLIGQQAAFVEFIDSNPGQVNVQLPSNTPTGGPLPITVMNGTMASNAVNVMVNTAEPGLLAPASFLIGGKQYVVALLPDGATYILPSGAITGVTSRPAKPGDTIMLYGIGFGSVTPAIPAGQIVTEQNELAQPLKIFFGQTAANVTYDGLAPSFVGLYQFNVVVPQVPDNLLTPLTFTLGDVSGTQTLYIAVQQGS